MAAKNIKRLLCLILVCCCVLSANYEALVLRAADSENDSAVVSISVLGTEKGIELWQGFEIFPYDYQLSVSYDNGTTETIPMTVDMIGEYDNVTVGTRSVSITYLDVSTEISLTIKERQSEITGFEKAVEEHADAKNITLNTHKSSINNLKDKYNSFSGYEISLLTNETVEKYQELIDALYRLEHTDLDKYDTVYIEDFNRNIYDDEWTIYSAQSSGSWRAVNGMLVNEQLRYGWSSADKKVSYIDNKNFYGEINSVETDVYIESNETEWIASILSCVNDSGYYMARIQYTGKSSEGYGKIQLYKFENGTYTNLVTTNAQKWVGLTRKTLIKDDWNNLRLTTIGGVLKVYLNDTQMITYNDNTFSKGTFGFRSNHGDIRYDSLRVMGTKLESDEYVPQITETSYEDSFSDKTYLSGGDPDYWIEEADLNQWKLFDLEGNGNLAYGTDNNEFSYTWLHTFESNPTVTMDFMVEQVETDGRIEFLTRYTGTMDSYAGIGYDFSESKWYIYTDRGEDFESRIVYANSSYKLTEKDWYTIRIEENGMHIQVYVDNTLVVEDKEACMTGYGRVGVLSEKANLYIDNFSYVMPNGGSVNDGVNETLFDYASYGVMSHMEVESLGDGTLLGVHGGANRFVSSDYGLTWKKTTDSYKNVKGMGLAYPSILQLEENTYLMVYADVFTVWKSTDGMKSWKQVGSVIENIGDNKTDDGEWEHIIHVNSLSKVSFINDDGEKIERIFLPVGVRRFSGTSLSGHYTRIFYSDDYGVTWTESTNDTRIINPTYKEDSTAFSSWCESKIIMGSDSVLRMYNTREYDCVVYTESHDYGITWEGIYSIPYMQTPQSSYSITQDLGTGDFYMVYINNATKSYNSILPRNRISLAKSCDGKNWEFVMDIERFTSYGNYLSSEIYQILDPSILIADGYMYITMGRSYAASSGHNRQSVRLVRIDMSKLPQSTEWNDANIADATRLKNLTIEEDAQYYYNLGDTFSLYGGVVKGTAFNGEETFYDMSDLRMITEEPDMTTKGVYQVTLMNDYAQTVSFDVNVAGKLYQLEWNIHGQGVVASLDESIYEGQSKTFMVTPEEGWKLRCVMVNGEAIEVTNNQFVVTGSGDAIVDVILTEDTKSRVEDGMLVYYEDEFETEESYTDAIDAAGEGISNWTWSKGSLKISTKGNWYSLFGGIHARKNYTISADVKVPATDYLGVVAYGSSNAKKSATYGYEFAIYNGNFRLYKRATSGSATLPDNTSTPSVKSYFEEYNNGDKITLSLTAVTTVDNSCILICKACYDGVTKIIFEITDSKFTEGMAGIRGNSAGSSVENVCVTNAEPMFIETFENDKQVLSNWGSAMQFLHKEGSAILDSEVSSAVSMYLDGEKVEELAWSNYIYEADVTLTDVLYGTKNGNRTAVICAGATTTNGRTGYEWGVSRTTDGTLTMRLYDRAEGEEVYNAPCEVLTDAYENMETVRLKMVVRDNKIRCYVDSTYICEYEVENKIVGTVGVRGNYAVSVFDNLSVTLIQDNYVEIDDYRAAENMVTPDNDGYTGYVFGGWYNDSAFVNPLSSNTKIGDAYAKWVDEDVLAVKAQISSNLLDNNDSNDTQASIRFVTTVDSLDYKRVGFMFTIGGRKIEVTSKVVYKELFAVGNLGSEIRYAPWSEFSPQSSFFKAYTFTGLPKEDFDTSIGVQPFWVTLDGTYVYGQSSVKTVNMGLNSQDGIIR